MKTKTSIACLAAVLVALGEPGRAAGNLPTRSSHRASFTFEAGHHARQTHRPVTLPWRAVSGVVPRAIRGGNPLEMLNPFTPAKYSTAEENALLDPDAPGKATGINLLSISF